MPRLQAPEPSMSHGIENATPAAIGLLHHAVRGAHESIDRFADSAAPASQAVDGNVAAAEELLRAKTGQLRDTRDAWSEGVRTTVRRNLLVCVACALALGAVIARIAR